MILKKLMNSNIRLFNLWLHAMLFYLFHSLNYIFVITILVKYTSMTKKIGNWFSKLTHKNEKIFFRFL